ncbi:MAG: nuclear transport factor 2 family protein [Rhodanobacter sp.]
MSQQNASTVELIRAAYAAFNARDMDAALGLMTPDAAWPRAFKGGFVQGPEEVRAYRTAQWSEIDPHVEPVAFHPADRVFLHVHQLVRDMTGTVIPDEHVGHRFTIYQGRIQIMEVSPLPPSSQAA